MLLSQSSTSRTAVEKGRAAAIAKQQEAQKAAARVASLVERIASLRSPGRYEFTRKVTRRSVELQLGTPALTPWFDEPLLFLKNSKRSLWGLCTLVPFQ